MNVKALIDLKSPISLIVPILLAGCTGYQYVASPRFLPLNEKKGELTANVYLSGVQVGYAFSNKFSVFATGYQRFPRENVENIGAALGGPSDERVGQSSEINIGVSYFGRKENLLYEVLAGGGLGEMSFATNDANNKSHYDYSFYMEANKWNVFIQPNFSFKFNKTKINDFVSLGVFAKFNLLQYYDIETELYKNPNSSFLGSIDDGIEYFNGRTEAYLFFIEPGVFVKVGWKNFKGTAQIAPVVNLSGHAVRENDISVNMGFVMKLDLLKKKNKE